jgi:uncharacterized membrane protein
VLVAYALTALPSYDVPKYISIPLVVGGTAAAIKGLIRGRRARAPGDDLWYVTAALLGAPFVLISLVYVVTGLIFGIWLITCQTNCSLI